MTETTTTTPTDPIAELLTRERSCIFETRVEMAAECKEAGATSQKTGDYAAAVRCYERALFHVEFDEGTWAFELLDKHRDAVNVVRLPVYLNLAACYLHETLLDPAKVHEHCDLALAIDADSVKALYRKGQAFLHNNDSDGAAKVLAKAARLQPNDKAIRAALAQCKEKQALARDQDKKRWGGHLLAAKDVPPAADTAPPAAAWPLWMLLPSLVVLVAAVLYAVYAY
ncbi:hypothetical protein SPRG_14134 [Saprolegnia parasitica CBS 223.65]|uniref:Uncharacterized protein n=1 Tax=Saprolegnia parasitica (strain CBS 223.65) TaxID=695850 RepID=A0A067BRL9_SAPPC|nr:hypothetical protein SPRG_14134 [Saprolegnia parasitica CBS 223.65]KDO20903.1 hypothetical protein SPRG_14134 [Saprolegnia parasitica CBS 223.65]|eukprot:XP_012208392.1 hypothetical protein SPRG_14134 [Saprolegnia parasitica CBS 223.65]